MQKLVSVISINGEGVYFTSKTDTLSSVEKMFNMPKRLIAEVNNLTSLDVSNRALYVKKYSKIYTVKPTDTIESLKRFGDTETLYKINKITYFYPGQKIIIYNE